MVLLIKTAQQKVFFFCCKLLSVISTIERLIICAKIYCCVRRRITIHSFLNLGVDSLTSHYLVVSDK